MDDDYNLQAKCKIVKSENSIHNFVPSDDVTKNRKFPLIKSNFNPKHGTHESLTFANNIVKSTKYSIATSSLRTTENEFVQKVCCELNFRYEQQISDKTTHLVVKKDDKNKCKRTYKYMLALSHKLWIVSIEWLDLCWEVGGSFPEEYFEISSDSCIKGDECLTQKNRLSDELLLRNYVIMYVHQTNPNHLSKDQIYALLEKSGATLVHQLSNFSSHSIKTSLILVNLSKHCKKEREQFQDIYKKFGIPALNIEWLLECITNCKEVPFERYLLITLL